MTQMVLGWWDWLHTWWTVRQMVRLFDTAPRWIKGCPQTEALADGTLCPLTMQPCACDLGCERHPAVPVYEVNLCRHRKVILGRQIQFLRRLAFYTNDNRWTTHADDGLVVLNKTIDGEVQAHEQQTTHADQ